MQTFLMQTIQFSISIDFVHMQLNVKTVLKQFYFKQFIIA